MREIAHSADLETRPDPGDREAKEKQRGLPSKDSREQPSTPHKVLLLSSVLHSSSDPLGNADHTLHKMLAQ